ncbi:MAG: putative metal-binding motif-containing protein [Sandaracinaceae bacterium]
MSTAYSARIPTRFGVFFVTLLSGSLLWATGCASGSEDDAGTGVDATTPDAGAADAGAPDTGTPPIDANMPDTGPPPVDGGGGVECGAGECTPFQFCDDGTCRDYPACRGDGTCDRPEDVCHNRRCVPGDVDVDGDSFPANMDCDETDPEVNPGASEICNMIDDDCNEMIDDGDPSALCEFYPGGGECMMGSCGCDPGTFDLDRSVPGCECMAQPALDVGLSCGGAIDVGSLNDSGQVEVVSGNVMPDDREVWYRFRGVDSADTTCDNYHVRVQFTTNPNDSFEFNVFRGTCESAVECAENGLTDYNWATDFRATVDGRLAGECPCSNSRQRDISACSSNSADYFIRVRRRAGSTLACDPYTIEISNGLYDTAA